MVGGLMIGNNNKKRASIMSSSSLSLFSPIKNNNNNKSIHKSSVNKSSFQQNWAVVGLGIVAALGGEEREPSRAVVLPRSNPIPILPPVAAAVVLPNLNITNHNSGAVGVSVDDMEFSEDYTCVISHIGDNLIKKTEYFDGVLATLTHSTTATSSGGGDEVVAVKAASFQAADFLKSCYLCDKHLHGLDIFMYRGEKAFCSAECRYEQMVKDERKEKEKQKKKIRGSLGKGATTMKTMMKNKPSFEFSSSTPCSSPIQLIAGIVAA